MMEKSFHRSIRISQELQKHIALIIQFSLKDPRIKKIITVSEVKVSKDLSCARVFVRFLEIDNNDLSKKNFLIILNKSSNYIRKLLCKRMKLRIVPKIFFHYDTAYIQGYNISLILDNIFKK